MTDQEFIRAFQEGTLPESLFRHRDHVRAAWLYLRRHRMLPALASFSADLQRFAAGKGKPDRYHETITWAYLFLVRERMEASAPGSSWEEFAAGNADLLDWGQPVIRRYYTRPTLDSALARRLFLLPDRLSPDDPRI